MARHAGLMIWASQEMGRQVERHALELAENAPALGTMLGVNKGQFYERQKRSNNFRRFLWWCFKVGLGNKNEDCFRSCKRYALTGHLTTKSDVYSYGVVLLELLTGRVPVDMKRPSGEGVLVSWALPRLTDRDKVLQIMDPSLEGQYSMKDVVQVAAIAAMCVQPEADYRPLMADVVQSLIPLVKSKSTSKTGSASSFHAAKSPSTSECGKTGL
ncbi:PTI1-like tyrosine-protein kinase 2 [Acorus calamus]|uniref:PTI1-like tyrosine-protein kinase 2 n=1 Tax=Acorus calamus TaxID=4465 RepID=A0AAV9F869_ACOCL|nr:PTI1-like tyrosine-protein kinase 2 [Acorus calamus]